MGSVRSSRILRPSQCRRSHHLPAEKKSRSSGRPATAGSSHDLVVFCPVVSSRRIAWVEPGGRFRPNFRRNALYLIPARCWQTGGKGGTRTLDPGIMSLLLRARQLLYSTACQGTPVAIGTTKHNRARRIPASLPRCSNAFGTRPCPTATARAHECLPSATNVLNTATASIR